MFVTVMKSAVEVHFSIFLFSEDRMRERLLKKGRLQVVSELSALPKTTHDANSFVVDVNLLSVSCGFVTVCTFGIHIIIMHGRDCFCELS